MKLTLKAKRVQAALAGVYRLCLWCERHGAVLGIHNGNLHWKIRPVSGGPAVNWYPSSGKLHWEGHGPARETVDLDGLISALDHSWIAEGEAELKEKSENLTEKSLQPEGFGVFYL